MHECVAVCVYLTSGITDFRIFAAEFKTLPACNVQISCNFSVVFELWYLNVFLLADYLGRLLSVKS